MVHALQEARRVLVSHGTLIDLRPYCVEGPLEIITSSGCEAAGLVDMSLSHDHDIAADNAIQTVLQEEVFKEMKKEFFDFAFYWESVDDMKADMDDRWKEDVILADEVLQQAHLLFDRTFEPARVRLRMQMKLTNFEKHITTL
jgi:hypothetical protein